MDDIETLNQLGIGYAVSSPIGTIALTLGPSPYWSMEQDFLEHDIGNYGMNHRPPGLPPLSHEPR